MTRLRSSDQEFACSIFISALAQARAYITNLLSLSYAVPHRFGACGHPTFRTGRWTNRWNPGEGQLDEDWRSPIEGLGSKTHLDGSEPHLRAVMCGEDQRINRALVSRTLLPQWSLCGAVREGQPSVTLHWATAESIDSESQKQEQDQNEIPLVSHPIAQSWSMLCENRAGAIPATRGV